MNLNELKNNKYFVGQYAQFKKYRGWFIGSFFEDNHPGKTDKIEIQYNEQPARHICKSHYHKEKIEVMIMLKGKAKFMINDHKLILKGGDFIFVDVNNIIKIEFIEDSKFFAIHAPSIPNDKISVGE